MPLLYYLIRLIVRLYFVYDELIHAASICWKIVIYKISKTPNVIQYVIHTMLQYHAASICWKIYLLSFAHICLHLDQDTLLTL